MEELRRSGTRPVGVLDQLRSWVWDWTSGCTGSTEELGLGPDQ